MIFAAYLAANDGSAWHQAVSCHAAWLGLAQQFGAVAFGDRRRAYYAWLGPFLPADTHAHEQAHVAGGLVLSTSGSGTPVPDVCGGDAMGRLLADPHRPAAIRIGLLPATGEVLAAVPPAAVEQLYFAHVEGGWALSNDLRLMARLAGDELDEVGLLGLFRYGVTPAPLTVFRGVRRVPVGHILHIGPAGEPSLARFTVLGDPRDREPNVDARTLIRNTLDTILEQVSHSPVVYFSGGVDSSLIAARLAALGRTDATLINYAFGSEDPKAHLARRIADHLGLRFQQVVWNPADIPSVLERIGRDYPFPFCDVALVPGNILAHAAVPLASSSRTTVHGVGAGAPFGQRLHIRRLWRRLDRVPVRLRQALAWPYGALALWRWESAVVRPFAVLRRSTRVPLIHTVMCEHPMEGIAYTMPPAAGRSLDAAIGKYLEPLCANRDYDLLVGVLQNMYFTSREFSAIVLGPQMAAGVDSVAPFMEPLMMRRAFALTWDEKRPNGVPKGLLRELLAECLPTELVRAAGGSFLAPQTEIYTHPAMRAFVGDVVLCADNPLMALCRRGVVRAMLERLLRGHEMAQDARKFAWTVIFASAWLRQIRT